MQSKRAADAEVVSIEQAIVDLDLLAFDTDVGDPVLAATVGAPGHVKLQVLIEIRETFFQFFDQPTGEAFGFGDRQLAELGSAASYGSSRERRAVDLESNRI